MNGGRIPMLAALLTGLIAGGASELLAQGAKSDRVVKATATADKLTDGKQTVTITLDIDPKYYLYANPVGNPDYESNQVKVIVGGKNMPESVKVDYPPGKVKKDTIVGDYKVYEGKVTIKAAVQRAKGDTGALQVSIKLQACSGKACLLPATIQVAVP